MKLPMTTRSGFILGRCGRGRIRVRIDTRENSSGARRLETPPPQRGATVRRQVPVRWPASRWTNHPIRFLAAPVAVVRAFMLGCLAFCAATAPAATTNVTYGSFFFSPSVVTIRAGDTVTWSGGLGSHTVAGTGSDPICGGAFLPCMHTFNVPGTFTYQCNLLGHAAAGMTGAVVVVGVTITPAVLTNVTRLPNGDFRFTVKSTANQTNVIQASTNLTANNWVPISTTPTMSSPSTRRRPRSC